MKAREYYEKTRPPGDATDIAHIFPNQVRGKHYDGFDQRYGLQVAELFGRLVELSTHLVPDSEMQPKFVIDTRWASSHTMGLLGENA